MSGFFVEQAFAHINGANGAKGEDGIKGSIGGNVKMEQKVKVFGGIGGALKSAMKNPRIIPTNII